LAASEEWLSKLNEFIARASIAEKDSCQKRNPVRYSLLVIDDDRIIRETLSQVFSERYECDTADRAEQALECIDFQHYDAIITDISMPGVGGLQILRRIQARHIATPVIIISGNGDEFRDLFMEMGAFAYFTKPFHLEDLELAIGQAIASNERFNTMRD
jgi:DNA-binding NtrC family response regulator